MLFFVELRGELHGEVLSTRGSQKTQKSFEALQKKLCTPDLGLPWKAPWKLDFGGCFGALAKLALKLRFGLFLVPAKGGVLQGGFNVHFCESNTLFLRFFKSYAPQMGFPW